MGEVKLFGAWGSPMSGRVELALRMKGVAYDFMEEDLSNKSQSLLTYNPVHKKIPVLLHHGKPICESLVILEYIDETWQTPFRLFPSDSYQRAMARFWAQFIDEKCMPALWRAFWGKEEEKERDVEEASELLRTLEGQLKGNKFFGGDTIGVVDIAANFIGFWLGLIQEATGKELLLTEKDFPELYQWTQNFVSCGVVGESLPSRDKLLEVFQNRFRPPTDPSPK